MNKEFDVELKRIENLQARLELASMDVQEVDLNAVLSSDCVKDLGCLEFEFFHALEHAQTKLDKMSEFLNERKW